MATTKAYAVKGTTSDVTDCDQCGRSDLRGTIALESLDADGNGTGVVSYFGSDCGAMAAGWTQKDIRKRAKLADDTERARRRAEADARSTAFCDARDAWCFETYGTRDVCAVRDVEGRRRSSIAVVDEFMAATGTPWI